MKSHPELVLAKKDEPGWYQIMKKVDPNKPAEEDKIVLPDAPDILNKYK